MRLKLISCEVFLREVCFTVARSLHIVDLEFTPKGAHDKPDFLRGLIQDKINQAEKSEIGYDAILLGFGLCGNSTLGLKARKTPLVIPRAHDCCTIFLGSKEKFIEYFGNRLSSEWTSVGYLERGESYFRELDNDILGNNRSYQELVEQYGEENAKYVWETLHPNIGINKVIYIEVPEFASLGYAKIVEEEARKEGKEFEKIAGDMRLIENLVNGDWNEEEFLVLKPGEEIRAVYDHDLVVTSG
ncbi:MAG: hypothetical protein PWR10_1433 [Halanaerobiales bacterium]|nr:hypothetical protein [Halanaerobiales bacterium]